MALTILPNLHHALRLYQSARRPVRQHRLPGQRHTWRYTGTRHHTDQRPRLSATRRARRPRCVFWL